MHGFACFLIGFARVRSRFFLVLYLSARTCRPFETRKTGRPATEEVWQRDPRSSSLLILKGRKMFRGSMPLAELVTLYRILQYELAAGK